MKDLSDKELQEAPSIVMFLYIRAMFKEPVGSSMIEEAIRDYPEYFSDEVEHRRKWAFIPQSVHEEYHKEYWEMHTNIYKDLPQGNGGIIYWADHPEEYNEWKKVYNKLRAIEIPKEKELHKKYYSQYGI